MAEVDDFGRYRRTFDDKFVPRELPMSKRQKIRRKVDSLLRPDDPKVWRFRWVSSLTNRMQEAQLADAMAQLIIADIKNQVSSSAANNCELPSG